MLLGKLRNPGIPAFRTEYKYTTNFGRALLFMQAGVPVVAEASPSNAALLGANEFGRLVVSAPGWKYALSELIGDEHLRGKLAEKGLERSKDFTLETWTQKIQSEILRWATSQTDPVTER